MPRRTRAQQDAHNANRRRIKQEGRKAIVCMSYIKRIYPQIHREANEFYTMVNERYPTKRDLTKTHEFIMLKQTPRPDKNITTVEPLLEITLMGDAAVTTATQNTITPLDMTDETYDLIIQELRKDPDIAKVFDQIMQDPDIVTIDQGIQPQFTNEEQDQGIQQQITTEELDPDLNITIEELHQDQLQFTIEELHQDQLQFTNEEQDQGIQQQITTEELDPDLNITIEELHQDQPQSTFDESEAIDQIIQEIRQDPALNKAFDDLELQLEFDQLGEDLPELDEIM